MQYYDLSINILLLSNEISVRVLLSEIKSFEQLYRISNYFQKRNITIFKRVVDKCREKINLTIRK